MTQQSRKKSIIIWTLALLFFCNCAEQKVSEAAQSSDRASPSPATADTTARRRALLVGINDYSATSFPDKAAARSAAVTTADDSPRTSWPSLKGAINDVETMQEMLISRYRFQDDDIEVLTDQDASREAILGAIKKYLVDPAQAGEHMFFYYSGHGSQVVNSESDEPDKKDESLVPADSKAGAQDIRDKELRPLFNKILARGAHLTVILDSCHSGSGVRGYPAGAIPRGLATDLRDVKDGSDYGPKPEDEGALVLAAAQDFQYAWETRDAKGDPYGSFSLALFHAMRSPTGKLSADQVFRRAHAQVWRPDQEPVIAGTTEARQARLFSGPSDDDGDKTIVAVKRVESDGTYILEGGWAHGLGEGSELQLSGTDGANGLRLRVTELLGLSRCKAEAVPSHDRALKPATAESGSLFELVKWTPPQGRPLRVWIPRASDHVLEVAKGLATALTPEQVGQERDPIVDPPTHVLRWHQARWQLLLTEGGSIPLEGNVTAKLVKSKLDADSKLFVELPLPDSQIAKLGLGQGSKHNAVEVLDSPDGVDYVIAGRLEKGEPVYAWIRPSSLPQARRTSALPPRSDWYPLHATAMKLQEAALRLAKIYAWDNLVSPSEGDYPYQLELKDEDGGFVTKEKLYAGSRYSLTLRLLEADRQKPIEKRYVYVFAINERGDSVLLFPTSGNVENRFPLALGGSDSRPAEIPLGPQPLFEIVEPFGRDNYFLLTSVEPIHDPWVLEYGGVRTRGPTGNSALEELLSQTGATTRSPRPLSTPLTWSIAKRVFQSVNTPRPAGG